MTNKLHHQVEHLQHKVHDLLDDHHHPAAHHLTSEIQGLEDDTQVDKNPRSVEDRIKRIIRILEHEAKEARIMNYEHIDYFRREFEELRKAVAKLT